MKPLKGKYLLVPSIACKGEHLFWDPSLIGTDAFLSVICLTYEGAYLYLYLHLHRHLFERYHDEGGICTFSSSLSSPVYQQPEAILVFAVGEN